MHRRHTVSLAVLTVALSLVARAGGAPYLVKDISPGTCEAPPSYPCSGNPTELTLVGDAIFFRASDPATGAELWRTDGTAAGTTRVADINPGPASANPQELTDVDGRLFFLVGSSIPYGPTDLWMSDGTASGTVRLADYTSLPSPLYRVRLKATPGGLLVAGGLELWRTDGTAVGTVQLVDFHGRAVSADWDWHLENMNGSTFFTMCDRGGDCELWSTDGTPEGTIPRVTITPPYHHPDWWGAPADQPPAAVYEMKNVDGTLFFATGQEESVCDLWKTDGTAAGTSRLAHLEMSAIGSDDEWAAPTFGSLNGRLYFPGCDHRGCELWTSDGTPEGTRLVADINTPERGSSFWPTTRLRFVNVNGVLLFNILYDDVDELWRTDGTEPGTFRISSFLLDWVWWQNRAFGDEAFFLRFGGPRWDDKVEIWKTDGTIAGTQKLVGRAPGWPWSPHQAVLGGRLFFVPYEPQYGAELWAVSTDSVAEPACGNDMREPGEECDDGNERGGDGCDAGCRTEAPGETTTSSSTSSTTSTSTTVTSATTATIPFSTSSTSTCTTTTVAVPTTLPRCLPTTCDDGDPCTVDRCNNGCVFKPDPRPSVACRCRRVPEVLRCAPPRLAARLKVQLERALGCAEGHDGRGGRSRWIRAFRRTVTWGVRTGLISSSCAAALRAHIETGG